MLVNRAIVMVWNLCFDFIYEKRKNDTSKIFKKGLTTRRLSLEKFEESKIFIVFC